MPYINIQVTNEGVSAQEKVDLIAGATQLLVDVLGKSPSTTFVVIEEVEMENWGIAGLPVEKFRAQQGKSGGAGTQ